MGAQLGEETKEDELLPNDQSKTMKAVVCTEYGEPSKVVKLVNVPIPIPEDDQLLIEIHSAALNPSAVHWLPGRRGTRGAYPSNTAPGFLSTLSGSLTHKPGSAAARATDAERPRR